MSPRCLRHLASLTEAAQATLTCGAWQVRELADMLRSVGERLAAVQTAADGERSRLEHTVQDLEGRLRHLQSTATQLRWAARRLQAACSHGVASRACSALCMTEPLDECCLPVSTTRAPTPSRLCAAAACRQFAPVAGLSGLALHAVDLDCWGED